MCVLLFWQLKELADTPFNASHSGQHGQDNAVYDANSSELEHSMDQSGAHLISSTESQPTKSSAQKKKKKRYTPG